MTSLEHAACKGALPELFEVTTKNEHTALQAARPALAYCDMCPCKKECIDFLDPAGNGYSVVAGGIVWVQGKPVFRRTVAFNPNPPTCDELVIKRFGDLADLEQEVA